MMRGKELIVVLLLGISISCSFGRYNRRQSRAESPWDSDESWLHSSDLSNEYSEERRSVPVGFSAVRGKRTRDPQTAALVSALMKLAKLRSREALRGETLQDKMEREIRQQLSHFSLPNEFDSTNNPGFDMKRSSKNYMPTDRREVPQGFFIARGKKQSDPLSDEEDSFRFFTARGKKSDYDNNVNTNRDYDPSAFESLSRRAVPEGFYLSRGKRDLEIPTYGATENQKLPLMEPHAAA